jgi:polar amino acid transport system ATP-binding protein
MNAEIETFCERQILPKNTRHNLLLLVEELLLLHQPLLGKAPLELQIAHSEKHDSLELVFEQYGVPYNPLEQDLHGDDFGIRIIEGITEALNYQYLDHRNRVTATLI